MKAAELKEKLLAEGCNENNFAVMSRGNDSFCLDKKGDQWAVFYAERGHDSEPIFTSADEAAACEFFYQTILKIQHWHLVGFFQQESQAISLEEKLKSLGIQPVRNDIPAYQAANDPRYRVFVVGKDIFAVRKHFGQVIVTYT